MNPFIHLSNFRIIVCSGPRCKYAVLPVHVDSHLSDPRHNYNKEQREQVVREISQIEGLIQDTKGLESFAFPEPTSPAIPELRAVMPDGLQCKQCPYICRNERKMRGHCKEVHNWMNEQKKGRPSYKKRQSKPSRPWISEVHCQQFFAQGPKKQLFEVMREEEVQEREPKPDIWTTVQKVTTQRMEHIEKKAKESIQEADENAEPNPWLKRVGWIRHLKEKNPERLRAAIEPPNASEEPELQAIIESFGRVIDTAQRIAVPEVVGINALFEVNRKIATQKPAMPFSSYMGDDTLKKYRGFWEQLLCYMYRMQEDEAFEADKPGYQLTRTQQNAFKALVAAVDDLTDKVDEAGRAESQDRPRRQERSRNRVTPQSQESQNNPTFERIDRLCLELCIALLNHELGDDEYEGVIISGLAVLGFRDDGGWLNAEDYTTKYSGIIKVARMLVVYRSYIEREDGYEMNRKVMEDDVQARSRTEPMFDIVRRRVRKFMTLVSDKGRPTQMDWIYECRTYGMKIRYNTTAEGVLEWEGNRVLCQGVRFNMEQLRGMMHGLVEETRRDLMDLMMLEMNAEGEVEGLPPIDWERLSDNPSEEKVGWSFLKDIQNKFAVDGKWWLLKRVSHEPRLQREWIEDVEGDHPYRMEAVAEYQQKVEQFQEKLLLILHMVGGQPARATELIGMRYANTKQGGLRNIFIDRGMVAFVTTYHKNYRQTGKMKIIHRYLPREVGELLLRYLWLVLPFWQAVQSVTEKADQLSPFIWADAVAKDKKDEKEQGDRTEGDVDEGDELGELDFKTMHQSKQWTSERIRKIMQKHSEKWLGVRLNISAWTHIAIGISRRYLRGRFTVDEEEEVDWETFDEDNLDGDSPWDLQAGHGTHIAGMIYARLLRQAPGQTMGRQDMFRQVSQEWHRFLQFTSTIQGVGIKAGIKRPRSEWEHIGRDVQFRRFKQMCHVNIHRKLKELMGEKAEFRGLQEKTIHAIMTGQSPIVSIMATGQGKSLSFMLPAYCISGGTTVVIIPLCSLQEDLERRCKEARIECVQWDSRKPHETASIVLVTPESAVTKTFNTYINRLRGTYQLDRVVIDECHVVLDSGPDFRPKLRALGAEMVQWGTQLIFLTATLPPKDEDEFSKAMRIPQEYVHMFRGPTTRRNIRYQVQEVEGDIVEAICEVVKKKLDQYATPSKIVVYGSSVEQTIEIGEALECPIYHRSVDDRAGKARRMKELMEGRSRVIAATDALGLGVDLPDIRVVIHAGQPRKLSDYAQESGRAGRDGKSSEAIIVCGHIEQPRHRSKSWAQSGEEIFDFVAGHICQRIIMDQIMDGRMDRVGCEEGEEQCDVCRRQEMVTQCSQELPTLQEDLVELDVGFGDSGIGRSMSSQVQGSITPNIPSSPVSEDQGFMNHSPIPGRFQSQDDELQTMFEQQQRERQWLASNITKQNREEGQEIAEFEEALRKWVNRCPLCKIRNRNNQHQLEECQQDGADDVREALQLMVDEMTGKGKRRFENYSCCFHCYIPQAICQHWQQKDEQGWWKEVDSVACQFKGIVMPAFISMLHVKEKWLMGIVYERMVIQDQEKWGDDIAVYKWLGKKVKWVGIEATKLCQIFHALARMVDE